MCDQLRNTRRFMLLQRVDGDSGDPEQHRTAALSVVGGIDDNRFLALLHELDYGLNRFVRSANQARSGNWERTTKLNGLEFCFGVVFLASHDLLDVAEAASELRRFQDSGLSPVLAMPNNVETYLYAREKLERLHRLIPIVLIGQEQLRQWYRRGELERHIVYAIHSVILPATYPGLVCVDQADVMSILAAGTTSRVLRIKAPDLAQLSARLATTAFHSRPLSGLLTLLCSPPNLKVSEAGWVSDQVQRSVAFRLPDEAARIAAALADSARDHHTLVVLACE